MSILDIFKSTIRRKVTIPQELLEAAKSRHPFNFIWKCVSCSAQITIRSQKSRGSETSNFQGVYTPELCAKLNVHRRFIGHSIVPSGDLNWNGLLEERNWIHLGDNKAKCPACQKGMTIEQFKAAKKAGLL